MIAGFAECESPVVEAREEVLAGIAVVLVERETEAEQVDGTGELMTLESGKRPVVIDAAEKLCWRDDAADGDGLIARGL